MSGHINFYFRHTLGGQFDNLTEDEHLFAMRGALINLRRVAADLGLTETVDDLDGYIDEITETLRNDFGWEKEGFEEKVGGALYHHYTQRVVRVWNPAAKAIVSIANAQRSQSETS
jgi:hypothetical protein